MTPWVGRLLLGNVLTFLVTVNNPVAFRLFAFQPASIVYQPWSPITYMFIHAGFSHIFFNMLFLFFFGPRLEARLGSGSFIRLYMFSGLGGALLSAITPFAVVVGASGAILGIMMAFVMLWPHEKILLFFVLPIPVKWLVAFQGLTAIWSGLGVIQDNTAHYAHLGGIAVGYGYMKWLERHSAAHQFQKKAAATVSSKTSNRANLQRWQSISREGLHEINRDELDRIMEKITSVGVDTLTLDERAFLDRFSPSH